MYKEKYECLDPFKNTYTTFDYVDTSSSIVNKGYYNEVFFDCSVKDKEFLAGTYKIYIVNNEGTSIDNTVVLTPKIFTGTYPSTTEIMFNGEDNTKGSFMIHNSYLTNSVVYVNYKSYGAVCQGKSAKIFESSDLIGMISFKNENLANDYFIGKCNGGSFNKEIFSQFNTKFNNIWGGNAVIGYLPNYINCFPRAIGDSTNEYSNYYRGTSYSQNTQRIPKIKWMNNLIDDHSHTFVWTKDTRADDNLSVDHSPCSTENFRFDTSTVVRNVYLNGWGNIIGGANFNVNNFVWSNKFEPKNFHIIPYVRMR